MNTSKVVLITGVTRGLGLAMAEKFIALKHTVLGCGRNQSAIDQLRRSHPKPHDFENVDVANDDQVRTWAEEVYTQLVGPEVHRLQPAVAHQTSSVPN